MMFTNRFYTGMTASANRAEAPFACAHSASNNAIALIVDAVIAASIIIALISISLMIAILVLGLSDLLAILVLVLVGLLVLGEVNRRRRRVTA